MSASPLNYALADNNPLIESEQLFDTLKQSFGDLVHSHRQKVLRDLTLPQINELLYPKALPRDPEALLQHPKSAQHLRAMRDTVREVADQLKREADTDTLVQLHDIALLSLRKQMSLPNQDLLDSLNKEAIWTLGLIMKEQKSDQSVPVLLRVLQNPNAKNHHAALQALQHAEQTNHPGVKQTLAEVKIHFLDEKTRTYAQQLLDGTVAQQGKKWESLPGWFKELSATRRQPVPISKRTGELASYLNQIKLLAKEAMIKVVTIFLATVAFVFPFTLLAAVPAVRKFLKPFYQLGEGIGIKKNLKAFWKSDLPLAKDLRSIASYYKLPVSGPTSAEIV